MKVTNFINEIGNKIKIKIKKQKDTGMNYKTKKVTSFQAVNILISGPTSESENIITYKEASELYTTLGKFLGKITLHPK